MSKQFDESKHPRDETGKFTDGVGTKAEQDKLKNLGVSVEESKENSSLSNEEKRLQKLTGEKVEKVLTDEEKRKNNKKERLERDKRLANIIKSFDPIPLKIGDKKILAEFDKFTAKKNIYNKEIIDRAGVKWKKEHIEQLPKILKNVKYIRADKEKGKDKAAHKGVKQWHYFRLKLRDKNKKFNLLLNVREKNNRYFIYEIKITKRASKKKKKRV